MYLFIRDCVINLSCLQNLLKGIIDHLVSLVMSCQCFPVQIPFACTICIVPFLLLLSALHQDVLTMCIIRYILRGEA
jgi:hypothetical protein